MIGWLSKRVQKTVCCDHRPSAAPMNLREAVSARRFDIEPPNTDILTLKLSARGIEYILLEMGRSYIDFVDSLSARYPTLTALAGFLRSGANPAYTSRIRVVHVDNNSIADQTRDLKLAELLSRLNDYITFPQLGGMVVLLEDPGPDEIEKLGSALDIDPIFFCGHVATAYKDVEKEPPPPIMTMFPSQASSQEFVHIHCQKVLDLGVERLLAGTTYTLVLPGNCPRQVRLMQPLSGRQLALLRTCTSVLRKRLGENTWVCTSPLTNPP